MTNFARMWLELVKVCPEIGALWEPDDRQEWACPECGWRDIDPGICNNCFEELGKNAPKLQPIPRLDQLVGMVPNTFRYPQIAMLSSISTWATDYEPFETIDNMSMEELWLTYIAYEHRLKWTGKEGEPWEW